jgi:hypothetical protein
MLVCVFQYLNLVLFQEMFLTSINVQELGFDTLESFLLSLSDTVLQLRYINKTIFVCALVQDPEPESFNPLPHIAEVRVCYRT